MSNRKVMVVDDELHLTHIVKIKLEQAGFEVRTACNGEEGYRVACEFLPDLIVTDYEMPRLNGHEMCRKLADTEATCEIPVMMLTARGHKLSPSEFSDTRIVQLLDKPFAARELIAAIRDVLGIHDFEASNP